MQASIETTKTVVWVMAEAAVAAKRNNLTTVAAGMRTGTSIPVMKQPTFNWKDKDKYTKLLNS